MTQQATSTGISRRTLARGAAWAAPTIAMLGAAPAASASTVKPPPPSFNASAGWKNPGNSCTSTCVPKQSYGIQVTVNNPTPQDYTIEFTSYDIGGGTGPGVFGVTGSQSCAAITGTCKGGCGSATNSVCIPAGSPGVTFYVTSNNFGASPNGGQSIGWQWVNNSGCTVESSGTFTSPDSPPGC